MTTPDGHEFELPRLPEPERIAVDDSWPDAPEHTQQGARILRERGVDEEIVEAILSHAEWNEIPRDTPLKKALFAVDELAGFVKIGRAHV